jgi:hypothetical protein
LLSYATSTRGSGQLIICQLHSILMIDDRFISGFVAMVPDADPLKHRCVVETSVYRMIAVLAKDEEQTVDLCREMVAKEGVQSIILCPGFTNRGIGRITEAVGKEVAVCVARGDGPSSAIAHQAMERAGFFKRK